MSSMMSGNQGMYGPPAGGSMMGGSQPQDYEAGMMQGQYPTGPAMNTYNGHADPAGQTLAHGHPDDQQGHDEQGGHDEHGGGGHATIDKETGITPRRCTDFRCCFGWLILTITLLTLLMMSKWYGNVNALTHGRDYYGRVCGIDAGVENMPFLYWCRNDAPASGVPAGLELLSPSCVASCPVSYNTSVEIPCLRPAEVAPGMIPPGQFGNIKTQVVRVQESLVYTAPYPTSSRGGRFCMPRDGALRLSLMESWEALHPLGGIMRRINAGTLGHLQYIFLIVTATAILLGYLFFFCIKHCPKTLTVLFVYPAAFVCGVFGIYFILAIGVLADKDSEFSAEYMSKMNPLYEHYSWYNASIFSILFGVFLSICCAFLVGMGLNFHNEVGDLIHAGMICMKEVPGMYYLPIAEAFCKWLIFLFYVEGLRWFFTVGELNKNRIHVNGAKFAGLSREWHWNHWWIIACILWIVGFSWSMEMCNGFFQYLISKGTVAWYFTPKENHKKKLKGSPLPQGVKDAIIYHWGSIAYGAFWIPTWRPSRIIYWMISSLGGSGTPTTSCGKAIGCITGCFGGCCGLTNCCGLKDVLAKQLGLSNDQPDQLPLIKDAYTDIVIRANDFAGASDKAHMLLEHSHRVVQYMYREQSQTTLCVLGVSGIATVCAWVSFMICNFAKIYTEETSSLYIANPCLVIALSWVLAAYIAFGFMSAWDHCADTLLYCYAHNRKFSRASVEKYIPETIRAIVGYDDKEDDRYPYYGRAKPAMYLRSWIPIPDQNGKKKVVDEKKPGHLTTPQPSWFAGNSWMGSQPPMPAEEMQGLLGRA